VFWSAARVSAGGAQMTEIAAKSNTVTAVRQDEKDNFNCMGQFL
jgi:hypothetical protein